MPVFHTKTIESILEPVAQQVSRLVILHEEAEDGNAMPDLSQSVATVKQAVDNLIQIGYETVNTSDDSILKQDMPPALQRVEEAATSLLEASNMLKEDPFFAPARKKLINGSRGILQGTSALLLAFDESEVRKIIAQCRRVLEYIGITEVIESMDDLVTFVKNISPGLTRMTKQVDDREKELTHQVHKDILLRCLEEIKVLTPVLISGIKTYIQLLSSNSPSSADAKNNRDHTCKALGVEIEEIIRVLQLTSAGEDDIEADDAAILKNVLNEMEQRQQEAHDWLRDTQSLPGASGEKALHDMLASALVAAGRCPNPRDAEVIKKTVSDVQSMVNALNELRASGQGDSVQAQALAKGIEEKLADLKSLVLQASSSAEKSGAKQLAHTLKSQIEAALRWLRNPAAFDHGYGEQATRAIIADGRRLAATLPPGKDRDQLLKLCNDAEVCVNQLSDLCHRGMGGTPQAKAVARALAEKLNELSESMTSAVAEKVVEDFLDIGGPLKALTAAATAPLETPHREAIFQEKADQFQGHSRTLVETGKIAAANSGVQTKHSIEAVNKTAKQLADLSPMVVTSAKVVLMNPGQEAAVEHFNLVKQQWADNVEKLKTLMDENTDTQSFMKATEAAILSDTSRIEEAIVTADSQAIVDNAANIARRSNRILQVAQQEVDNSEDPLFQQELKLASDKLKAVVPQMVKNAKSLTLNPRSSQHGQNWRKENDVLVDCVRGIRLAVTPKTHPHPPPLSPYAAQADISQLSLDDVRDGAPPRPPPPGDSNDLAAPPRPPLPVDPDAEMERVFQQQPQENQPIMLAAHTLHQEVKHWESADNELVTAAKQMALLMAKLSSLVRGEGGSKKELIDTARKVAEQSAVVTKLAKGLAAECTDRRMRTNLLQVCERIPTIGTQLKILCTVKATMLGAQESSSQEDDEATEMLVGNAQNLMQSVRDTVRAAEGASIKIRVQSGYSLRWVRRRPWYT